MRYFILLMLLCAAFQVNAQDITMPPDARDKYVQPEKARSDARPAQARPANDGDRAVGYSATDKRAYGTVEYAELVWSPVADKNGLYYTLNTGELGKMTSRQRDPMVAGKLDAALGQNAPLVDVLNILGSEGWDLVTSYGGNNEKAPIRFVLKRTTVKQQ